MTASAWEAVNSGENFQCEWRECTNASGQCESGYRGEFFYINKFSKCELDLNEFSKLTDHIVFD